MRTWMRICAALSLAGCGETPRDYEHNCVYWGKLGDSHYTRWSDLVRKWEASPALDDGSSASISPDSPHPVGAPADFTLTYRVGREGIARGGSVAMGPFFIWSLARRFGTFTCDEKGAGHVVLSCSNPEARLDCQPVVQELGTGFLVIGVSGAALREGDTVTAQVHRIAMPQQNFKAVELVVAADTRGSSRHRRLPRHLGLALKSRLPASLYVRTRGTAAPGEPFPVSITCLDEYGNVADSYRGTVRIRVPEGCQGLPEEHRFTEADQGNRVFEGISLDRAGTVVFRVEDPEGKLSAESNPAAIGLLPGGNHIYMGDLHCHTMFSDGIAYPDDAYRWGRDVESLDFAALSDHSENNFVMAWDEKKIRAYRESSRAFHRDGRFPTFFGYEWTSAHPGHHNVYFRKGEGPWFGANESETPYLRQLMAGLQGREVLVIPHHPKIGGDWSLPEYRKHAALMPLLEICSNWGASEDRRVNPHGCTAQEALAAGLRMGFIGSTDDHTGRAGHGRGLCGVHAASQTREALFEALRNRQTYATSGVRILLDARADGHLMGSEFEAKAPPSFSVHVVGTAPIRTVEVLKDNRVVHAWNGPARRFPRLYLRWGWEGHGLTGGIGLWKGTATLSEGRFVEPRALGFDKPDFWVKRGDAPLAQPDPRTLSWESNTVYEDVDALTAVLEAPPEAELTVRVQDAVLKMRVADLPETTRTTSTSTVAGIPSNWLELSGREPLGEREVDLSWTDPEPLKGTSFYYVRVIQEDEEMAWSSPFWITQKP